MLIWHAEPQPIHMLIRVRTRCCQLIGYGRKGRIIATLTIPTQPIPWAGEASPEEYRLFLEKTSLTRTESVRSISADVWSSGDAEDFRTGSSDPHTEASEGAV